MESESIGTVKYGALRAEVYSMSTPGEFKIVYLDGNGHEIEEQALTGVSTYRQREPEILQRLRDLSEGKSGKSGPDLEAAGEY